jgi:hypothetical protein
MFPRHAGFTMCSNALTTRVEARRKAARAASGRASRPSRSAPSPTPLLVGPRHPLGHARAVLAAAALATLAIYGELHPAGLLIERLAPARGCSPGPAGGSAGGSRLHGGHPWGPTHHRARHLEGRRSDFMPCVQREGEPDKPGSSAEAIAKFRAKADTVLTRTPTKEYA